VLDLDLGTLVSGDVPSDAFAATLYIAQRELAVRADTLQLLSELTDEDLASKIPGAPWGDGTVGGVLAVHAAHHRMHRHWVEEATPAG
jgi:hypothetical protein